MPRCRFATVMAIAGWIVVLASSSTAQDLAKVGEGTEAAEAPSAGAGSSRVRPVSDRDAADYDLYGFQEIHRAAWTNDLETLEKLLSLGADPNAISDQNSRQTVLHVAARYADPDMVALLLKLGADPNALNWTGETPLGRAMYNQNPANALANATLLLDAGSDVNGYDEEGRSLSPKGITPVAIACFSDGTRSLDVVKLLVDRGANIRAQLTDEDGRMAIHYAAYNGLTDIVAFFLDQGLGVDVRDAKCQTPLMCAVLGGHVDTVKLLAERGADLRAQPLDGYGLTPIHQAAFDGKTDIVTYLLDQGVNPDLLSAKGFVPLHVAAENGSLDVVKVLAEHKANLRAKSEDAWEEWPIHRAAYFGQSAVIGLLLELGVEPDARTAIESTPLTMAAEKGDLPSVTLLVDHGADINLKGARGMTALQWAREAGKTEVVAYLKSKGATE